MSMHANNSPEGAEGAAPLVSVVIPTYNCARYIGETLKSVMNQDYAPLEVIVVDDGSTDNTCDVVKAFDPDRVTYLYQPNSGGAAGPRNKGIREARGHYIAMIDADDIMLPGKLRRAVALLSQEPQLGLVFTNFVKFDDPHGEYPGSFLDTYEYFRKLPKRAVGEAQYVIRADSAYDGLLSENYIGLSSVVLPKEVFLQIGLFDESLSGPEDYDLWLRITSKYDVGFIDMIGHRYRVRGDSVTARGDLRLIPHNMNIMRKQLAKMLPDVLQAKVRRKLAYQLWALGYCHQTSGDMQLARKHYLLSLREAHQWLAWKGLLMTMIGNWAISALKHLRGCVAGNRDAESTGRAGTGFRKSCEKK